MPTLAKRFQYDGAFCGIPRIANEGIPFLQQGKDKGLCHAVKVFWGLKACIFRAYGTGMDAYMATGAYDLTVYVEPPSQQPAARAKPFTREAIAANSPYDSGAPALENPFPHRPYMAHSGVLWSSFTDIGHPDPDYLFPFASSVYAGLTTWPPSEVVWNPTLDRFCLVMGATIYSGFSAVFLGEVGATGGETVGGNAGDYLDIHAQHSTDAAFDVMFEFWDF